jgi:hypothetical protein
MYQMSSNAYEMITRRGRYMKKGINIAFVVVTVGVNLLLIWTGLAQRWGFNAVLLLIASIFTFDAIFALPLPATGSNLQETVAHTLTPTTNIEIRTFIFVWLFWWVATQFLYAIGSTHSPLITVLCSLPMLASSLLVSIDPQRNQLASNLFPIAFLLVLLFPAKDWMPQYIFGIWAWVVAVFRVAIYFTAVFVADFSIRRHVLDESKVYEAINNAVSQQRRNNDEDPEDHERSLSSTRLFTTIAEYEAIRTAEQQRVKSIIALSAWILVVPRLVIPIFLTLLALVHTFLFFTRRHAFLQKAAADAKVTMPFEKPAAVASVGDQKVSSTKSSSSKAPVAEASPPLQDDEAEIDLEENEEGDGSDTATVSENSEDSGQQILPPAPTPMQMPKKNLPFPSRGQMMPQGAPRVRTNKIIINSDK